MRLSMSLQTFFALSMWSHFMQRLRDLNRALSHFGRSKRASRYTRPSQSQQTQTEISCCCNKLNVIFSTELAFAEVTTMLTRWATKHNDWVVALRGQQHIRSKYPFSPSNAVAPLIFFDVLLESYSKKTQHFVTRVVHLSPMGTH